MKKRIIEKHKILILFTHEWKLNDNEWGKTDEMCRNIHLNIR